MIKIGTPSNLKKYICLDGTDAFRVHQNGCPPEWRDGDWLYFKRSKKLYKILDKLEIEYDIFDG